LSETDIRPEYVKPDLAMTQLVEDGLDAFFIVAGPPVATLAAATDRINLVPIDGAPVTRLLASQPAYQPVVIPAGTYAGKPELHSIGVGAQLITRANLDEDLIYLITRALWSRQMQERLMQGHPKGREISMERALDGLAIPLHPGAARFYREIGLLQ
jgi:TRAP transporter TAXI family solute receptor